MRIALLLPGHPRTYKQTYESLKKNLLDVYQQVDIFIWCWDELGFWTPDNSDGSVPEYGIYGSSGKVNQEDLLNLYKPKAFKIEKISDHKQKILNFQDKIIEKRYPHVRPFNNVSCWYGIYKCDLLRRKYEEENGFTYDIVVRGRFDLELTKPLTLTDRFTFPSDIWGNPNADGYDDSIFFGSGSTMKDICDLVANIEEIAKGIVRWDSHSAFKYWVDKHYPNFEYRVFGVNLINTPGGYCKTGSLPS